MRRELTKDKISIDQIDDRILLIRGRRVMIDSDLAALYAVSTGRFNEQVKRNLARFPADFMFQLTKQEVAALRSQIAISNERLGRGGRRYLPYAFTEHGAIMAPRYSTRLARPRSAYTWYVRSCGYARLSHRTRCSRKNWTSWKEKWQHTTGQSATSYR